MGSGLVLGTGSGGGGAPTDAQYVVLVANATLTQERVLTGSASEIVVTDGGAGAAVTLTAGTLIVQTDQANTWTTGIQTINTGAAGTIGLIVKANAGQTANLTEWQDSAGNVLVSIAAGGATLVQPFVDTTTAFQVMDTGGGAPVLSVDTVNERVGIGTAVPGGVGQDSKLHIYGTGAGTANRTDLIVENSQANGAARIIVVNGDGNFFTISATSAGFPVGDWAFFGGKNLSQVFSPSGQVFSGAAETVRFRMGGYGVSNDLVIFSPLNGGRVGIGDMTPGARLDIQNGLAATVALLIQGAAAQTAAILQLQDSTGGVVVDSGDGLAASEFVFNQGGIDIDFRVESATYDAITVDAATDALKLMDNAAGLIGFFGTAPVNQLSKADYNNWAAFGDVVDALVAIGLFDAA